MKNDVEKILLWEEMIDWHLRAQEGELNILNLEVRNAETGDLTASLRTSHDKHITIEELEEENAVSRERWEAIGHTVTLSFLDHEALKEGIIQYRQCIARARAG